MLMNPLNLDSSPADALSFISIYGYFPELTSKQADIRALTQVAIESAGAGARVTFAAHPPGAGLVPNGYTLASCADTIAECIHCLWHDVTARAGEEHLPAPWLRRLELLSRCFPPDRGHRLFPRHP